MTQISPRHAQDMADHYARMHRAEDLATAQRAIAAGLCALGLVILAAAAGYLTRDQACFATTFSAPQAAQVD